MTATQTSAARATAADASARSAFASLGDLRDPRALQPFLRLGRLLDPVTPGRSPLPDGAPVNLAPGDPMLSPPKIIAETLARYPDGWSRYPLPRGPEEFRAAALDWLGRRYGLPAGLLDPSRHLLPVPGSREGLFFTVLAAVARGAAEGRRKVLIPAPGYHVYAGGAIAANAEPVFVPARRETGFLPDYASLPQELLDQASVAVICSPSNPEGAAADLPRWRELLRLARRHGFLLVADECYAETYLDAPPAGLLQAALAEGGSLDKMIAFHSLSKRSSAAGLRCGFGVGAADVVDSLDAFARMGGAGVATPVMHAGAALYRDDVHAAEFRAFYRNLFDIAERKLGNRFGWSKPAGGFFLWLEVGDGEAAATRLWREGGIRVMPGAYMCPAAFPEGNPGAAFIRAAMIHPPEVTEPVLDRLVEILG